MYSFYDFMQMGGMPQMKNGGDPDGEMAIGQIMAMHEKLSALQKFIQPDSDLEPWVASKLTLADDYLNSVADYMQYNPEESGEMQPDDESQEGLPMEQMRNGGYTVTRSNDRKGKTHKVTGPDGTVKYFGDSKLGQHPKDPERKAAFYARHKKNLDRNPYFRAFARATWKEGGETDLPKYQTDGWVKDAANGKFFCKTFGRPDMGGGSGGYYTTAKEAKPVSNFDYISNLDNDLWFGKDELKQVRKTRPKDVDEKVWNALNSDARWVTNDFTNKSRWDADKINPATGRLDDKYLADEWRPKINITNRYRYYNNIFKGKPGPVTAQDLYNYYSAQPGGWEAYKTLVNNDYMQKKKNGGSTFSGNAWYQVGGEPRIEDYPDYGSWKSAYDAYIMAGNSPEAAQAAVSPFEMAAMQQQAMAQNDMIESDIPGGGARPLPPELRGQAVSQQMPVAAQPAAKKASIDYQGVSIVDLLGSAGKASDYNSRKQLAAELGIDNYYGSAQQNLEMIKRITKDPSVLNDYKTASVYKPKAKTASRSGGNKPKTTPSPVEQQAAFMFTPEFFANQKKNYLAANPSISSEQYDAMFGPKQPTTFISPSSKNLPANPERENNPYYYDDSYILNQIKNDPGTPGNIRKRKQKEFITDLAVGTLLPWLAESALMAATTRYLPYGLKALPEVSSAAQKYLPGIAKRLPAPGPANWVTNSGLAYQNGGDTPYKLLTSEELAALAHQFRGMGSDKSTYVREHDGIANELGYLTPREKAQLQNYMNSRTGLQSFWEGLPNLLGGSGSAALPANSRLKNRDRANFFSGDDGYSKWVKFQESQGYKMGGDTPCYECGGMFAYGGYLPEQYAEGGISIDPKKRGTFKAQATRMGMSTQEAASAILDAPEGKYSPEMRRKANFARNFAKQKGGPVVGDVMDVSPEQLEILKAQGYDFEII